MSKKSVLIKEDKLSALSSKKKYLLPDFLYQQLKKHHTSLGEHPAFPSDGDYDFDYTLTKNRFKEIVDNAVTFFGEEVLDKTYAKKLFSRLLRRCKEIERPLYPQLEKVAYNAINRLFAIPEECILYDCKLVEKVKNSGLRVTPESDNDDDIEFDDLTEREIVSDMISKQRFLYALIEGGSIVLSRKLELYEDEIKKLNSDLLDIYIGLWTLGDLLLFMEKAHITDKDPNQGATAVVKMGNSNKKTQINVEGIIFPFMFAELIKGFLEQFISYGLPLDIDQARYILKKSDYLKAGPWNARLGVGLWKGIIPSSEDTNTIPYVVQSISMIHPGHFSETIKEILAKTRKGKSWKKDLFLSVKHDMDYQEFENNLNAKNVDKSVIDDGYFTPSELDSFFLDDEDDGLIITDHENSFGSVFENK